MFQLKKKITLISRQREGHKTHKRMLWIFVCNFYIFSQEMMYILDRLAQFCPSFVTNPFNNTKFPAQSYTHKHLQYVQIPIHVYIKDFIDDTSLFCFDISFFPWIFISIEETEWVFWTGCVIVVSSSLPPSTSPE